MNLRIALYELAARYRLSPLQTSALSELAGFDQQPAGVARWLLWITRVLAAALFGLGFFFLLAANWDALSRIARFALFEGLLVASAVAALVLPAARVPLLLVAVLAQGAVLAFLGQSYQTGADAWSLFAIWALLALPLALAARSDVVWAPLVLVTMSAIALWTQAHGAARWAVDDASAPVHYAGWLLALAVVFVLSPLAVCRRLTGAGCWTFRLALTLAVIAIGLSALLALFGSPLRGQYPFALLLLALIAWGVVRFAAADALSIGVVVLALDVLLIAGVARWLIARVGGELEVLLLLGILAAGLVSLSVVMVRHFVVRGERTRDQAPDRGNAA